ncbi:MAG: beta-N-acetylhexosaminidase [Bacteroidales bacterium]|nr:beta-N-acetylhexosaminidase [Bacteroidales bacterium]
MAFAAALIVAACAQKETALSSVSLIPMPDEVELHEGFFNLKSAPVFIQEGIAGDARCAIDGFTSQLALSSGKTPKVSDAPAKGGMNFLLNDGLSPEEYLLKVDAEGLRLEASAFNGFLYGLETLKQLLPPEFYSAGKVSARWTLPFIDIKDSPRFAYRGMHLDSSRHFWSIDEVKRYIDIMLSYKLNRFHWHLTDDQGWRVEIKRFPRLTEVGSMRKETLEGSLYADSLRFDGTPYGGFYTQDEMREVVAYAAARGITVIPEIDLPGHMVAALTAYPELGCTGGPYEVWTLWGISEDVLCPGNEKTFEFIEGVLDEICDIFPSEYIHIGGDECPKVRWAACPKCQARIRELKLRDSGGVSKEQRLQNYVTSRVQDYLASKGRKIIGWDEILEGELSEGATVMSWRGTEGGIEASARGFDAIMTPYPFLYLDYYQSRERDHEPLAIGGYLPLERVYSYEPFDGLTEGSESHILGVQANLWTEYIATPEHLEYMLLPRLLAVSEIQWCKPERKDYGRFLSSLPAQFRMLDIRGYTYHKGEAGFIGLPGAEYPVRTPEELESYLQGL